MKKTYNTNLPNFEKYKLIDTNLEDWNSINSVVQKENISGLYTVDFLYLKGINRSKNKINIIYTEQFFDDYLKLGENLFKLATKNHKILLTNCYEITDIFDLSQRYITPYYFDIIGECNQEELNLVRELARTIDILTDLHEYELMDLTDKCVSCILLLIDKNCINKSILEFSQHLSYLNNKIDEIQYNYDIDIIDTIDKLLEDYKKKLMLLKKILIRTSLINYMDFINLNKELSLGIKKLNKIKNVNFKRFNNELPLSIIFGINQKDKIKYYIINWVKKYGFPYYVFDEENYHKETKKILPILNDNEEIIPCNILVYNSIFNYMYYTVYKYGKNTDEKILNIFGIRPNEETSREIRKHIVNIKESIDYNNSLSCPYFRNSYYNENSKRKNYNKNSDNYFYYSDNELDDYNEKDLINNLCVLMNKLVSEETNHFNINKNKDKICPICNKTFKPNQKQKKYCSVKCSEMGRKQTNKKNKRIQRQRQKKKME